MTDPLEQVDGQMTHCPLAKGLQCHRSGGSV